MSNYVRARASPDVWPGTINDAVVNHGEAQGGLDTGQPLDLAIDRLGQWYVLFGGGLVALLDREGGFLGIMDPEDGIPPSARRLLSHPVTGDAFIGSATEGLVIVTPDPLARRLVMERSIQRRGYRTFYIVLIATCIVLVTWYFCVFNPPTTILLVRHAEKAPGSGNVNLSGAGQTRADALVNVANEAGVSAVYANEWCRTAQTAQPLVAALGLPLHVQQVAHPQAGLGGCNPGITAPVNNVPADVDTSPELVQHLLDEHRGQTVLIVGHSNTVPEMVEVLGGGAFSAVHIDEPTEFHKLFIVTVRRFFTSPKLVKAQYGN